jgi:hypothetical protein
MLAGPSCVLFRACYSFGSFMIIMSSFSIIFCMAVLGTVTVSAVIAAAPFALIAPAFHG